MPLTYHKTEAGQSALHNRASPLSRRQRSAFIMFDGRRSVADVLRLTVGLGVTEDDIAQMRRLAYLEEHEVVSGFFSATPLPSTLPPSLYPEFAAVSLQSVDAPAPLLSGPLDVSNASVKTPTPAADAHASYLKAYPLATRLTAELGLRGFLLNLAVESCGSLEKLGELAPKIGAAVCPRKFRELEDALR